MTPKAQKILYEYKTSAKHENHAAGGATHPPLRRAWAASRRRVVAESSRQVVAAARLPLHVGEHHGREAQTPLLQAVPRSADAQALRVQGVGAAGVRPGASGGGGGRGGGAEGGLFHCRRERGSVGRR